MEIEKPITLFEHKNRINGYYGKTLYCPSCLRYYDAWCCWKKEPQPTFYCNYCADVKLELLIDG